MTITLTIVTQLTQQSQLKSTKLICPDCKDTIICGVRHRSVYAEFLAAAEKLDKHAMMCERTT